MIVVDIGNTNIIIGVYIKSTLRYIFCFETKSEKIISLINKKINNKNINKYKIDYNVCIVSSVVPEINNIIIKFFKNIGLEVFNINHLNTSTDIKFNIDNPKELGNDRIANTISAINKFGKNCLILDFGTATTFDIIKNNAYEGGIIAPGINISHDALIRKASQLNKISISKTRKIVGKNTVQAMQSGFYWGYTSLINGIIEKVIIEKKYKPSLILTGGLANIFKDQIIMKSCYEPHLTLEGLYLIGLKKYA